jgi:hypothetical protein
MSTEHRYLHVLGKHLSGLDLTLYLNSRKAAK